MTKPSKIAVTGMACIFPGARDLSAYLENLDTGYDAIKEVPENRWEKLYYKPELKRSDRFYCQRGGFIDDYACFDPFFFGIMPIAAEGAEPDQLLSLKISYDALIDAGYELSDLPFSRTGIILGRGNYIGPGMVRLEQHVRTSQQLVSCLESLIPGISKQDLERVRADFQAKLGNYGPDTAIGLVPNLTASRVANRLNFGGPAYTIDAACASSLMAIDNAVKALQYKQCDLMLAGGVHLCHDVSFWSVFTQLGVLSRSGVIRPFGKNADGLLIGEGLGVVVLKRHEDAVKDGDRIYAVINGVGVSSDGNAASLMLPDIDGQVTALERAWEMSGLEPEQIGYIEAHGTGTPAGDASELNTLSKFFKKTENKPGLGSVKSMIGHCMPAAGVAGFIKTALSLYHKKRFPSLHCTEPNEGIKRTGFRLIHQSETWLSGDTPRIAGVNAFGFGGINVHVVMSEAEPEQESLNEQKLDIQPSRDEEEILIITAKKREALLEALEKKERLLSEGPYRLVIFDPDDKKRAKAKKIILKDLPWRGRGDIFYSPKGLSAAGGKTAFLFPGVDSAFEPRLDDVADYFKKALPDFLKPGDLEETGVGIIRVNQFIHTLLLDLGINADLVAGHSIGEWSGMIASGIVDTKELDDFIINLEAGSLEVPDLAFAAAGCGIDTAESFFKGLKDIAVSNDNCAHQVILCGIDASIDTALEAMKKKGIICQKLPFRSGFHSPLYAESLNIHRKKLDDIPIAKMKTPLWSATTCSPYPDDKAELKQLIIDHLVKPVRFRELILKLYDQGVRVFIQAGTGSLSGFVQDILKGKEFAAINTNTSKITGMRQLRRALAGCFIEGLNPDLESAGMLKEKSPLASASKTHEMKLSLGVPLVRLDNPIDHGSFAKFPERIKKSEPHPVLDTYQKTISDIVQMQEEVLDSWHNIQGKARNIPTKPPEQKIRPEKKTFTLDLSLASCPWLIDHSLFPQYKSCTNVYEKYPVVPLTMSIDILCEYAKKMAPGKKVTAIEKIQAFNWIEVCRPLKAEIEAEYDGTEKVRISIKGYLSGIVSLGDNYPLPAEKAPFKLINPKEAPVTAEELYEDGWMFHGPAYQGVKAFGQLGENGIKGTITPSTGRGSLLDNAGQLFGYWVMVMSDKDKLAMPIGLGKIEFFSDHPDFGSEIQCLVKSHPITANSASADMELSMKDKVWARISDWEDRRFYTDDALFDVMKNAGTTMLSSLNNNGFLIYRDIYKTANSTNYISRRYCTESEKRVYDQIKPKEKRQWLNMLIAVKDSIRHHLLKEGASSVFPGEISLQDSEQAGHCIASGPSGKSYRVVTACKGDCSLAMVIPDNTDNQGIRLLLEKAEKNADSDKATIPLTQ